MEIVGAVVSTAQVPELEQYALAPVHVPHDWHLSTMFPVASQYCVVVPTQVFIGVPSEQVVIGARLHEQSDGFWV